MTVQRSTVTAAYRPHSMYTWLLYAKEGGHFEATDSQFWLDQTAQASNPHFAAGSGIMTVAEGSTGLISGCEITWVGGHEPQSPAVGVTEDSELEMGGCQLRAAKVCANQAKICMQKCRCELAGGLRSVPTCTTCSLPFCHLLCFLALDHYCCAFQLNNP